MNFTVITHVVHGQNDKGYIGYGPYVREINLWIKHVDEVTLVAPLQVVKTDPIFLAYQHHNVRFKCVKAFSFTSVKNSLNAVRQLPNVLRIIYKAMQSADHIHLRCPGNIGLLGCVVQIFFPHKPKTAKYAGNWDPKAKQPLSYRFQKWLLSNTFLTRNMQVLVYGEWNGSSQNIKPFFTATYSNHEIPNSKFEIPNLITTASIRFLFVGTLSAGKRPMYALQLIKMLRENGFNVQFDIFGEGIERNRLEEYILENKMSNYVVLHGNQSSEVIEKAYKASHFLILPSKSEGWPKVVAEAMFWGCVPVASRVSCVANMLDDGERGILLQMNSVKDVAVLEKCINHPEAYKMKAEKAIQWSRKYTLDYFEAEIEKLVKQ